MILGNSGAFSGPFPPFKMKGLFWRPFQHWLSRNLVKIKILKGSTCYTLRSTKWLTSIPSLFLTALWGRPYYLALFYRGRNSSSEGKTPCAGSSKLFKEPRYALSWLQTVLNFCPSVIPQRTLATESPCCGVPSWIKKGEQVGKTHLLTGPGPAA